MKHLFSIKLVVILVSILRNGLAEAFSDNSICEVQISLIFKLLTPFEFYNKIWKAIK